MEVKLRTVESTVAFVYGIRHVDGLHSVSKGIRSKFPFLITADAVFGSRGQFYGVFETETGIDFINHPCDILDFRNNLFFRHKNVSIILR